MCTNQSFMDWILYAATSHIIAMTKSNDSSQYLGPDTQSMTFNNQKLAIVTYPNYYGECFDIRTFVDRAHREAIPVLVDEAHGAHFNLKTFQSLHLKVARIMLCSLITRHCPHSRWDLCCLFIKMRH